MNEPSLSTPSAPHRTIRILSYNVHSCVGTDRKLDPARVADVIASLNPDIIGLQELDVGRKRSGGIDQAEAIAMRLKMDFHFHPALHLEEELYGDALMTALPMRLVKAAGLASYGEPRGALWAEVDVGETTVQVINTHLGLLRRDRLRQARELLGPHWLGHPTLRDRPAILMGDFNSIPSSKPYRELSGALADTKRHTKRLADPTFPSRFPLLRLDHIFVVNGPEIVEAKAVRNTATRRASDHLPLIADIRL